MTFNQEKIYAVIYDRFMQKRYYTTIKELAYETKIDLPVFRTTFWRMNGKYFTVKRIWKKWIIEDVQRISNRKSD